MKKIYLVLIVMLFQFFVSAEEIFKDIRPGKVLVADSEGYIYVNAGNHSIKKYSPRGKFLLEIGRKGEGPSDIKRMGWFAISPLDNHIYVTEFFGGNKWLSRFSTDGKYLGELNCEIDWKKWNGIPFIKFDDHGNIYLQMERFIPRRYKDFTINAVEKAIVKFSPTGKKLKDIFKMKVDFSADKGGKGNITIPFHNYLFWNTYGDKIFVRENKDDFISVFDLDGNFEKKIPLPFKKEKVTQRDLDDWEEYIKSIPGIKKGIAEGWFDLKYWKARLPIPEYKPVASFRLVIDAHGNLYSMKYSGYNPSHHVLWAKINLSTGNVSMVNSNPKHYLKYIWKNYFFILKLDEEDNYVAAKIDAKEFFKER